MIQWSVRNTVSYFIRQPLDWLSCRYHQNLPLFVCIFVLFQRKDKYSAKFDFLHISRKSTDGVRGIWTLDRRLQGADESTELCRPSWFTSFGEGAFVVKLAHPNLANKDRIWLGIHFWKSLLELNWSKLAELIIIICFYNSKHFDNFDRFIFCSVLNFN